jgi:hypothetical protein
MREEWEKHSSVFAATWLTSMRSLCKLRPVPDLPTDELLRLFRSAISDRSVQTIVEKDVHLVAAALASDRLIVSLDDRVRRHLASLSARHTRVGATCWVNPCIETEHALEWLQSGAPTDASRQLRNYRK